MPRTGENIYKRKNGRWEGRYIKDHQHSGKAIFGYVYAYSYKEVKAKLNLAISGHLTFSKRRTQRSTFSELSELWLESKRLRVKESTYNKYRNILHKYIRPYIGNICLQDLSLICITELCDTLLLYELLPVLLYRLFYLLLSLLLLYVPITVISNSLDSSNRSTNTS